MPVSSVDQDRMFLQFRHSVGAPIRQIEITDDMLCSFLQIAIENYTQYVLEYLVEFSYQSVLGADITTTDFAFAFSVRSQDFVSEYTYAYSKQVGLQTNGPWELKKDYINIEAGRQVYEIPAGREINSVLYFEPNPINQALMANFGGIDYGFGGGVAQVGGTSGGGAGGRSGYYIAPAFDILLTAQDIGLKNKILRSDLVYKITAGPNGTRLLHLLSTPGSKFTMGHGNLGGSEVGGINLTGCQVWYHYYDTTSDNVDQCRLDNPDIIRLPNEVPLSKLDFNSFNEPTKILIRQLFVAEAKMALGRVRGKFSGVVGVEGAERVLDYESLLSEGNDEKRAVLERLDARLLRLSSTSLLQRAADEATSLNTVLKYRPMGFFVI